MEDKKENITVPVPPEAEDFNLSFDKEINNSFSKSVEMVPKPIVPDIPQIPQMPSFPSMKDIENMWSGKIPETPNHFTIKVPAEFDPIIPPEPLGAPPPPPAVSDI